MHIVPNTPVTPAVQVYSGQVLDLLNPDPAAIDLNDICIALSRLNRFSGHTRMWSWSVAEHSLLVEALYVSDCKATGRAAETATSLALLMHDFAEAYTGDIASPMKAAIRNVAGFNVVRVISERIDAEIRARFGVSRPDNATRAIIHHYDMLALSIERKEMMKAGNDEHWRNLPEPESRHHDEFHKLRGMSPSCARNRLLENVTLALKLTQVIAVADKADVSRKGD